MLEVEENMVTKNSILKRIPLERIGTVENIAQTVLFIHRNNYITGQIIAVDGGRTIQQ